MQFCERLTIFLDWDEAHSHLKEVFHLTPNDLVQIPRFEPFPVSNGTNSTNSGSVASTVKRRLPDEETEMNVDSDDAKRSKVDGFVIAAPSLVLEKDAMLAHAQAAASYISFLKPEHLLPPKLPTRQEMESILLDLRKKALVEEYFGEGER